MKNHFETIRAEEALKQKTLEKAKKGSRKKLLISSVSAAAAVLAAVIGLVAFAPSWINGSGNDGTAESGGMFSDGNGSGLAGEIADMPSTGDLWEDGAAAAPEEGAPAGIAVPESQAQTKMTAAVLDDHLYFEQWLERSNAKEFDAYGFKADRRITVKVTGQNGVALSFANVVLIDAQGNILYAAVTDIRGTAYLFYDYYRNASGAPAAIRAEFLGQTAETAVFKGQDQYALSFNAVSDAPEALDLLFMIDTTGSMGDELEYLKEETAQMLTELTLTYSTQVSINFYRDEGDAYVVKSNPFTADIAEAAAQLRQEAVDGGGDYPEAVEKALENGISGHPWRENSVKIVFLVLDAPAHKTEGVSQSLLQSIEAAARRGIRLVPVMASGADEAAEILCRQLALFTGGRFVFITDHSGIGSTHREPITTVAYEVKPLITILKEVIYAYTKVD